ncbi:hypothetical protein ACLKA6_008500 [Drosophila palustris]
MYQQGGRYVRRGFHSSNGVAVDVAVDAGAGMEDGASLGRHRHMAPVRAHATKSVVSVVWAAAPPAVAPLAAAPPGWVRVDELRGWIPLDADGNVLPAQPRPVAQPVPGWVQLDADGNVPPAQPR